MNHNLSTSLAIRESKTKYFTRRVRRKRFQTRSGWQIIRRSLSTTIILLCIQPVLSIRTNAGGEKKERKKERIPTNIPRTKRRKYTHLVKEGVVCIFQRRNFWFAIPGDGTRGESNGKWRHGGDCVPRCRLALYVSRFGCNLCSSLATIPGND